MRVHENKRHGDSRLPATGPTPSLEESQVKHYVVVRL